MLEALRVLLRSLMRLLRRERNRVQADIEYDYRGPGRAVGEITKCFNFCKNALEKIVSDARPLAASFCSHSREAYRLTQHVDWGPSLTGNNPTHLNPFRRLFRNCADWSIRLSAGRALGLLAYKLGEIRAG